MTAARMTYKGGQLETSVQTSDISSSLHILHNQILEVTDASKYLGVKVTEDLTWSRHFGGSWESKPNPWFPIAKLQTMYKRGQGSYIHHDGQTSA